MDGEVPIYEPSRAYDYILRAYTNVLHVDESTVMDVGKIIPLPRFSENILLDLCKCSRDVLMMCPIVLEVPGDVVVVGDLHGSFFDLLRVFAL
jgi:hypothetical protein